MDMYAGSNAIRKLIGALALSLALVTASFAASAAIPMAQLSTEQRRQTEAMLTRGIQRLVDQQRRVEGQGKHVKAQVHLDESRGFVIIDLSQNYLIRPGAEYEDLTHELMQEVYFALKDSIIVRGVLFTYDGKDVYDYFPEDKPKPQIRNGTSFFGSRGDLVVISAGHGRYIHFGRLGRNPTWQWQRPTEWNGIIEDVNNPPFADELSYWFFQRSFDDVITSLARSTSTEIHTPSGEEWWKVAGKYHLESILPDNPEIWNFKDYEALPLADYNNDINSRPQYANYLAATAVIHLHSNGSPTNFSARGTEVYYHAGREQSRLLGDSILCSMKEIIQAKEAYATFPVEAASRAATNKGENSLAAMPSVLVEMGYHTNPTDAAALLDPVFRTASMKGVEKGYRLYRENIPCEPFEITNIPNVSAPRGTSSIPVETHYRGYPQFPVKRKSEVVSCPSNWTCSGTERTFSEGPSPLRITTSCSQVSTPGTMRLRVTLTDDDVIRTNPVEYSITCT